MLENRLSTSSVFIIVAALGILISLFWFEAGGVTVWFTAKIVFFVGVFLRLLGR